MFRARNGSVILPCCIKLHASKDPSLGEDEIYSGDEDSDDEDMYSD